MSENPTNLAFRFLLELVGWFALGYWGFTQHNGIQRYLWGIGLPVLAAAVWGIFRVPEDSGKGLVAIPGWLRLIIEVVFFGGAILAFYAAGQPVWALIFAIAVLVHYLLSYDRVLRLIRGS